MNCKNIIQRLLSIVSMIIFGSVYISVLFYSLNKNCHIFPVSLLLFLTLLYLFISKVDFRTFFNFFTIMFVIQLFFGYFLMVEYSTWDVYAVTKNARALATGDVFNPVYFASYPNNLAILLLFRFVFGACNSILGTTSIYALVILNIFAIDISILFAVKFVEITYQKELAYRAGIMMTFFAPFYLYVPICYTDTFSLPFVTGLIYWFESSEHDPAKIKKWKYYANLSAIGIGLFVGYKLKGSLIILLIAMLIYLFIKLPFSTFCKITGILLIGFTCAALLWSLGMNTSDLIDDALYETHQMPTTHWVMMGLQGSGNYNSDDVNFTRSFSTYQDKQTATIQKIYERINRMGITGTLQQFFNKASKYGWNYGTCYAERYLGDTGDQPKIKNILHEFILTNGSYHQYFFVITQSIWLIYFGLAALNYLTEVPRGSMITFFLRMSLIGCMVFFMIWETHPRYILHFTPILILLAAIQMGNIADKLSCYIKSKNQEGKI